MENHSANSMSGNALSTLIFHLRAASYHFVTPTPATHHRVNQRSANATANCLIDIFGWSRPFTRSVLSDKLFKELKDGGVVSETSAGWKSRVRASSLGGDIFLHSAFPTVAADSVFFGPDTYRFARAINCHLRANPGRVRRAIDVGCGTGAGGAVVAKRSNCSEVVLTDINDVALTFSRLNLAAAGLKNATAVHSDLFTSVEGEFDLIVANPPYLNDKLQRAYRHGGGELGSALSISIAEGAVSHLTPGGTLLLYTGAPIIAGTDPFYQTIRQKLAVTDLTWSYEEIDPDVFGEELETEAYGQADRIAAVVLTARKPGVVRC
jgi:methylase of polypeptide subunit release factors